MNRRISLLIYLYVAYFIIVILTSACICGSGNNYYTVDRLTSKLLEKSTTQKYFCDNYKTYIEDGFGIGYNDFAISIYSYFTSDVTGTSKNPLISGAYACSPKINYPKLSSIEITSTNDFNDDYLKGENLADFFIVSTDCLENLFPISLIVDQNNDYGGRYYFKLIVPPTQSGYHNFNIKFFYDNGNEVSILTGEVLIKN